MSKKKSIQKRKPITTELQLNKLKSSGKPYDVSVANVSGLVVRVGASGTKSFRWDRGRGYKPRIITYGKFPSISLKKARDLHEKKKQQHSDGVIVTHESMIRKVVDLAELFYSDRILIQLKRPEAVRQVLDHDILPAIGRMQLQSVTTMVCRKVVKDVVDRGAKVHANKVLVVLKQMLNFGVSNGLIEFNTAAPLRAVDLGIENHPRDRSLTSEEIRTFWDSLEGEPIATRTSLRLLTLLGIRSGELRLSRWEYIDLEAGLLTIPVENQKLTPRKAKYAHPFVVPLSIAAIALFRELEGLHPEIVFPNGDKPYSIAAMGRWVKRVIKKGNMDHFTPRDLRRTMRTNLSKLNVQPHIAERCLNHSLGKILETYDTHDFLDERREALEKWSQVILGKHENVVELEKVG
jgi:integrase